MVVVSEIDRERISTLEIDKSYKSTHGFTVYRFCDEYVISNDKSGDTYYFGCEVFFKQPIGGGSLDYKNKVKFTNRITSIDDVFAIIKEYL